MSKIIKDQVSGVDVVCNLVNTGRGATLTMCANGVLLTETVRGADLTAARRAFSKRDLEAFGSFFERAEKAEAALEVKDAEIIRLSVELGKAFNREEDYVNQIENGGRR